MANSRERLEKIDSTPDWNILAKFFPIHTRKATPKVRAERRKKNKCVECEMNDVNDLSSSYSEVVIRDAFHDTRCEGKICSYCLDMFKAGDCTISYRSEVVEVAPAPAVVVWGSAGRPVPGAAVPTCLECGGSMPREWAVKMSDYCECCDPVYGHR